MKGYIGSLTGSLVAAMSLEGLPSPMPLRQTSIIRLQYKLPSLVVTFPVSATPIYAQTVYFTSQPPSGERVCVTSFDEECRSAHVNGETARRAMASRFLRLIRMREMLVRALLRPMTTAATTGKRGHPEWTSEET